MKTIEERAESYTDDYIEYTLSETIVAENAYIQGAKDQKKIDSEETYNWLKNNIEKYFCQDEAFDQVISIRNLLYDFKKVLEE